MSHQAPAVTIVIPARNEAARLPASLREIRKFFPFEKWEFLIVIEPGTDNTEALARKAVEGDARFRVLPNAAARGKGFAVKTGMLAAEGEVVFFMDADLSVPLSYVHRFLEKSHEADILIGSRRHPDSIIRKRQPWAREACGRVFNHALRLMGSTQSRDTQCGFKAFSRRAAQEIFSRVEQDGFGFDVEVLALGHCLGFRILEMPVEWSDAAGSHVVPVRDGVNALVQAMLAARRVQRNAKIRCQVSE